MKFCAKSPYLLAGFLVWFGLGVVYFLVVLGTIFGVCNRDVNSVRVSWGSQ